ncbi:MAG: HlyD family type I secretion periplasmic adaptor subunit [Sphingopyxis sp.]|nr:HlyD family type I secretion periplasmic adaptor subunit [Sphingopyxis sp.]
MATKTTLSATARATGSIVSRSHRSFLLTSCVGICAVALWASITEIDVVTRGSGEVVQSLQNQFVQHLEGGIVEQILVHEGQTVQANDVLMRISDSFSQAEHTKVLQELRAQTAKLARLEAESEGLAAIAFPQSLQTPDAAVQRADEELLFARRRENIAERVAILKDQTLRKGLERRETEARLENTRLEFDLTAQRVQSLKKLVKSGAASRNELLKTETALQQIQTKLSDLTHTIPQIEVELSELRRRQNEVELAFIAEADEEKIQTMTKVEQLDATLSAMRDRSRRVEVRAPIGGKVHRLFQATEGGVVKGGQNLVQLVPLDAPISVEIRLSPRDRGKVWKDLPAVVKLTAYDFSTYGGIRAKVTDISTDVLREEGVEPYFRVKLEADMTSFGAQNAIIAGMSAEVDIITGQRTVMDYLLSPVRDMRDKALREG